MLLLLRKSGDIYNLCPQSLTLPVSKTLFKTAFLKVIVLLIHVGLIATYTDLCCELPAVVAMAEHYSEHKAHDGMTIGSFLDFHYGAAQTTDSHHEKDQHDENLPLQGSHQCHVNSTLSPFFGQTNNGLGLGLSESISFGSPPVRVLKGYGISLIQPPRA